MPKSQKAAAAVEALYKRKKDAMLDEFMAAAGAADRSTRGMQKRSFNAIYVLPLKRKAGAGTKAGAKKKSPAGRRRKAAAAVAPKAKPVNGRRKKSSAPVGRPSAQRKAAGVASARQLVLDRDQQVLAALRGSGDPQAAYELAAGVDNYLADLAAALRG